MNNRRLNALSGVMPSPAPNSSNISCSTHTTAIVSLYIDLPFWHLPSQHLWNMNPVKHTIYGSDLYIVIAQTTVSVSLIRVVVCHEVRFMSTNVHNILLTLPSVCLKRLTPQSLRIARSLLFLYVNHDIFFITSVWVELLFSYQGNWHVPSTSKHLWIQLSELPYVSTCREHWAKTKLDEYPVDLVYSAIFSGLDNLQLTIHNSSYAKWKCMGTTVRPLYTATYC